MQASHRPEPLDLGSLPRSRSTSMSSDLQFPKMTMLSPPPITPAPAFIAASAASQIVTTDQEDIDVEMNVEEGNTAVAGGAFVTPGSLSLLNGFLDHLLFNILAGAKSTQLSSIRPAIADVLKPRFAKEVVAAADEELSEYMGGEEDEEVEFRGGQEPRGEFDLIRSWKLTRLRCMVYTRLGDMEEEDEDEYIEREGLDDSEGAPRRFSSHVGNITPAAAIFLTSIIEYIGEQALIIAGETARSRMLSAKFSSNRDGQGESGTEQDCRLVVEEIDMERLALNATLGRLWRTWRKRVRTPGLSRTLSRESMLRRGYTPTMANSRKSSVATVDEAYIQDVMVQPPVAEVPEQIDPASIALPITENDVNEIEAPGLSADLDADVQTMEAKVAHKVRPRSLMVFSSVGGLLTPTSPSDGSPAAVHSAVESTFGRHSRTKSLPSPTYPPYPNSASDDRDNGEESVTPSEERPQLETMYENDESAAAVEHATGATVASVQRVPSTSGRRDSMEPEAGAQTEGDANITPETVAESAQTAASIGIATSQLDSTATGDGEVEQGQVFEGQGMCEKPKLSAVQRPRRKSSREVSRMDGRSTYASGTSDSVIQDVVGEEPSSMQGVNSLHESHSTPAPRNVNHRDVKKHGPPVQIAEQENILHAAPAKSQARQFASGFPPLSPAQEVTEVTEVPPRRPTPASRHVSHSSESIGDPVPTSDDSDRSSRSRRRSRTNPQTPSGSQHRYGHSSPIVSPEPERAAVQRVARPSITRQSSTPKSRRSLSVSSREKRPVTAGSTTSSKLKGLIGRSQGSQASNRLRSSSEASGLSEGGGDVADDDRSGLDKLIKSEETIHYTLTPRNMRQMDAPDAPRWGAPRSDALELADFLRNTPPPGDELYRSQLKGVNGLRSNPLEFRPTPKSKPIEIPTSPAVSVTSSTKPKAVQARDARLAAESTRDFADFIRSTGPDEVVHPPVDLTNSALATHQRLASGSGVNGSRSNTPASVSQRPSTKSKDIVTPKRNGPRLQARPAATAKGDQTSDLIDFIREGPPTAGAHRIPRSVAPFRSTMDSDELRSLGPSRADREAMARSSLTSTQDGSTVTKSLHSSYNSRTGLMESTNRANARISPVVKATASHSSSNGNLGGVAPDDDEMRPVRKQRRVRDPYAIDSEDEDDLDELMETPKPKPPREEESLLDFLRSTPPPADFDKPPQPFSMNAVPPKSSGGISTASAMKARLLRNTSLDRFPTAKQSKTSLRSRRPNTGNVNAGSVPLIPSSAAANSIPPGFPHSGARVDNYTAGQIGYSAKVGLERDGRMAPASRREPSASPILQRHTDTGSLADFLKNTGPPEPPMHRSSPSITGDKSTGAGSFAKLFARRKKVEV